MYSDLGDIYDKYREIYENSLKNVYPATGKSGIVEMNLTVKFFFAIEELARKNGYWDGITFWNELQTANKKTKKDDNHIDGFVIDEQNKEIFLIESKRFYSKDRVDSLVADAKRAQDVVNGGVIDWKNRINNFNPPYKFFILLIADVWPQGGGERGPIFNKWIAKSIFDTSDWDGGPGEYISNERGQKAIHTLNQDYQLLCYCWKMGKKNNEDLEYKGPIETIKEESASSQVVGFDRQIKNDIEAVLSSDPKKIIFLQKKIKFFYFVPTRLADVALKNEEYKNNEVCFWVTFDEDLEEVRIVCGPNGYAHSQKEMVTSNSLDWIKTRENADYSSHFKNNWKIVDDLSWRYLNGQKDSQAGKEFLEAFPSKLKKALEKLDEIRIR